MAKQPSEEFKAWFRIQIDALMPRLRTEVAEGRAIPPVIVAISPQGEHAFLPAIMDNAENKDATFHAMKRLARRTDRVEYLLFITEAWVVSQDRLPDETIGEFMARTKDMGDLEHVPGRREVILFNAMSHGMQLYAQARIDRLDGISVLGVPEIDGLKITAGRMTFDEDDT